jgi:hypothetical protein
MQGSVKPGGVAVPTVRVSHSVDTPSTMVAGSDGSESAAIFKREPRKEYKNTSGIVAELALGVGVGAGGGRAARCRFRYDRLPL